MAVILAIIVSVITIMFVRTARRSCHTRTVATLRLLHEGCHQYRMMDVEGDRFPEYDGGSSRVLHRRLGGGDGRAPIVEFSPSMIEGQPAGLEPNPAREIVDGWGRPIFYEAYPGHLYAQATGRQASEANEVFSLWSRGPDGEDNNGWDDDLTNWQR